MAYKTYTSARAGFTIHWPIEWVTVQTAAGEPRMQQKTRPPTAFEDGRYDAKTKEEAELLEEHPSFGKDFFSVPSAEEIAEKEAEAEEEELERIEKRRKEILAKRGEMDDTEVEPEEPEDTATVLEGVSTKAEALEAMAEAGGNTDFAGPRTSVDDIVEAASEQGFTFNDWP